MGDNPGFPLLQRRSFLRSAAGFGLLPAVNTGDITETDRSVAASADAEMMPPLTWEWIGNHGDGSGVVQTLAPMQNGGIVCAGFESGASGTQDVLLREINQNGNQAWAETVGGSDDDGALGVTVADDGDVVFCGATQSQGSSLFDTAVGRFEPPDSLTWFTPHGRSNTNDAAHAIAQRPAGGYVVAGGTHYLGKASGDGVGRLLAIREDGSVRWDETYETDHTGELYDILQAGTDTYAFAGTRASQDRDDSRAWLGVVDGDGTLQWTETYGAAGRRIAYSVARGHGGGFVFAGATTPPVRDDPSAWIGKVDDAGSLEWEETYGTEGSDAAMGIKQSTDRRYVVAGWTEDGGSRRGWLFTVDSTGTIQWEEMFGGVDVGSFNSVTGTSYGYAAGGFTTESDNPPSGWVVGTATRPFIKPRTIELDKYAVERGGAHPTITVEIINATAAELEISYNGFSTVIPLENQHGTQWSAEIDIPDGVDPGTWVDLEISASKEGTEDTVGSIHNEYIRESTNLGYFVFEEVFDVVIIYGRFQGDSPDNLTANIDSFKDWIKSNRIDINHFYGSGRGSMGAAGFRITHFHNEGECYEIREENHYRNFDVTAGVLESLLSQEPIESPRGSEVLNDLRAEAAGDVDVTDYDFWIGRHYGSSILEKDQFLGPDGRILGYLSSEEPRIYVPFLPVDNEPTDFGFFYPTLLHEIGHAYGLAHLYDKGNVQTECIMGRSKRDYPDGVRGDLTDAPPYSTGLRLGEFLELDITDLNPVTDNIGDWLTVNEILTLDDLENGGRDVIIPELTEYDHGDGVTVIDTDSADTAPNMYLLEARSLIDGYEDDAVQWNAGSTGAVVIYRYWQQRLTGDVKYNVVEEHNFWDENDRYLLSPGEDTITDRIGPRSGLWIKFDLQSKSLTAPNREATVRVSLSPGDANTRTITLRDSVSVPGIYDLVHSANTVPTLSLKVVDEEGQIVGPTNDGVFVNEIPDARTSGKRVQGVEWVSVPEDSNVEVFVSSDEVERFIHEMESASEADKMNDSENMIESLREELIAEYEISETKYGNNPQLVKRDSEIVVVDSTTRIATRELEPGMEAQLDPETLVPLEEWENQRADNPDSEGVASIPVEGLAGLGVVGAAMLYAASRMLSDEEEETEEDDPWS